MRRLRYSVPYIAGKNLPKDSDSAPCGAGQDNLVPPPSYPPFQSTRPLRGGTAGWHHGRNDGPISIHPPCGAGLLVLFDQSSYEAFQFTRPLRGGTKLTVTNTAFGVFQSTRPLRGGTAILHKKTVQNIAYCTKSAFTLAVLSGFLALMRPFFLPNVHKFRCEPSEESLLAPRSHAYTIRTPSG